MLTASITNLALSVQNPGLNPALMGNPRQITITNNGNVAAVGLNIQYPTWPNGTSATSTCGSTLAVGSSCIIVITPRNTASSGAGNTPCTSGTAPIPGVVAVTASNVSQPTNINVNVIGYACQYQGGFVYSVDDTTPNTGSIGGKVLTLVDQAAPAIDDQPAPTSIIWSSNGQGGASDNVSYDIIPWISEQPGSGDTYNEAQEYFNLFYDGNIYPFPPQMIFSFVMERPMVAAIPIIF